MLDYINAPERNHPIKYSSWLKRNSWCGTPVSKVKTNPCLTLYQFRNQISFEDINENISEPEFGSDIDWQAALVRFAEAAIVSKDLNGIVTSWNKAAERIFGYKAEEIIGTRIHVLFPPSKVQEEEFILSKIRNGESVHDFETVRITKSGRRIYVSVTISPIRNSRNEIVGASKIARDISTQMEITRKLKKYNKELHALDETTNEFLDRINYELRSSLTKIRGYLQSIQFNGPESKVANNIRKTIDCSDKVNNLINSLLTISEISAQPIRIERSRFDINLLITDCLDNMALVIPEFQFKKEGLQDPVWVNADQHRIEQVVINLINNAIKYSSNRKTILVKVLLRNKDVIVSVTDFGIGIAENEFEKIFKSFYRVENSPGQVAGFGLGLYISKQIIDQHKGKLLVQSRVGQGSTFSFSLPLD